MNEESGLPQQGPIVGNKNDDRSSDPGRVTSSFLTKSSMDGGIDIPTSPSVSSGEKSSSPPSSGGKQDETPQKGKLSSSGSKLLNEETADSVLIATAPTEKTIRSARSSKKAKLADPEERKPSRQKEDSSRHSQADDKDQDATSQEDRHDADNQEETQLLYTDNIAAACAATNELANSGWAASAAYGENEYYSHPSKKMNKIMSDETNSEILEMMNRLHEENTQLAQQNLLLTQEVQKLRGVISQLISGSYTQPHAMTTGEGILNQSPSHQASLLLARQQFSTQQQQLFQQRRHHQQQAAASSQPNHVLQMLSQRQLQQLGQQGKTELQASTSDLQRFLAAKTGKTWPPKQSEEPRK